MAVTKQSIKLTLILWILGPRFPFFAGTSTQTCIPLLSYLFTQLSVDKHCLLKSAKTSSSGKILDILEVFLKNKLVSLGKAGARCTQRVGLRRFWGFAPLSTCIYAPSWSLIRSCRIFAIPADTPTRSWRHCTSGIQVRFVEVSSRSIQKGQPWVKRGDRSISSYKTAIQENIDEILGSENVSCWARGGTSFPISHVRHRIYRRKGFRSRPSQ